MPLTKVKQFGGTGVSKVQGFFGDFKDFISKGNILQLAVAFIMGVTFRKIITSLVDDIFGPIIALIMPHGALSEMFWVMKGNTTARYTTRDAAKAGGAVTLNYGNLCQTIVDFILTALCLFVFVKLVYCVMKEDEEEPSTDWPCPKCKNDNKEGAVRCGHCGAEPIYPEAKPAAADGEEETALTKEI